MLTIKIPSNTELIAVSDIHEHDTHFFNLLKDYPPSENLLYLFLGDLKDKGGGEASFLNIAYKVKELVEAKKAYFVKGNHELKAIKKSRKFQNANPIYAWLDRQPIAISFLYPNQSRYTCVHAGITPHMNWATIDKDINVCYTRVLDAKGNHVHMIKNQETSEWEPAIKEVTEWHEVYDGRFGYVISGHNCHKDNPKFYNYSCNIDSGVFNTGVLSAVIFNQFGKKEVIKITDPIYGNQVSPKVL